MMDRHRRIMTVLFFLATCLATAQAFSLAPSSSSTTSQSRPLLMPLHMTSPPSSSWEKADTASQLPPSQQRNVYAKRRAGQSWREADSFKTQTLTPFQEKAQLQAFDKRQLELLRSTAVLNVLVVLGIVGFGDSGGVVPPMATAYALGASFGLAFLYVLGKVCGPIDTTETLQGANIGQARIVAILLLYFGIGTLDESLPFLPALSGLFTYQLAAVYRNLLARNKNKTDGGEDGLEDPDMAFMRDLL